MSFSGLGICDAKLLVRSNTENPVEESLKELRNPSEHSKSRCLGYIVVNKFAARVLDCHCLQYVFSLLTLWAFSTRGQRHLPEALYARTPQCRLSCSSWVMNDCSLSTSNAARTKLINHSTERVGMPIVLHNSLSCKQSRK